MRIFNQGLILVAIPLAIEIVFVGTLWGHIQSLEQAVNDQARFAKLAGTLTNTNGIIQEAFFQAGFYAIDKDQKYSDGMREGLNKVQASIEKTKKVFLEDEKLASYQPAMDADWLEMKNALLALDEQKAAKKSKTDKLLIVALIQEKTADIRRTMEMALRGLQERALDAHSRTQQSSMALKFVMFFGLAFNLVVGGILLLYFSKSTSERLKRITQNSIRLARSEELEPPVGGNDEISTLDDVFHQVARALKVSADRERAVFENAVDVICALDGDGRIMRLNKAFRDLTEFEVEEAFENHIMEYVAKNDQEKAYEFMMKAKREVNISHSVEIGIRTESGVVREVLWSMRWDPAERSFFLIMHDITDRKELERAKQEFVNMVSHDLRSPLTSLRITLDLFLSGVFGEQTTKATSRLEAMNESIVRLIRLINDLLDVEKLEAGQMQILAQPTPAKQMIDTDISVVADGDRIVQVLVNLISNAIKFSPSNSVVEVQTLVQGNFAEFRVIDNGRGIPADQIDRIFERFKQVDDKDAKKGSGLGLAICKNIIDAHGGAIGVDSEEGGGSQFWFRLRLS